MIKGEARPATGLCFKSFLCVGGRCSNQFLHSSLTLLHFDFVKCQSECGDINIDDYSNAYCVPRCDISAQYD